MRVSRVGLVLGGIYLAAVGGCLGTAIYNQQAGDIIAYKGWVVITQLALAPGCLFLMATRLELLIQNTWLDSISVPMFIGTLFFYLFGSLFDIPAKPRNN